MQRSTVAVVVVVIFAGCTVPTAGSHEITFAGSIEAVGDSFRMTGNVTVSTGASESRVYDDVEISLYNKDKVLITSYQIGDLGTGLTDKDTRVEVNVTSKVIPRYVVIEGDDIWKDTTTVAYEYNGDYYEVYQVKSNSEKFGDSGLFGL